MPITIDALVEKCESLLKTAKELKEQQKPDPLIGCYRHAAGWSNDTISHVYFDGEAGYKVYKDGRKERFWEPQHVQLYVRLGWWVKIEEPKLVRKFRHRDGDFDRWAAKPFKYVEVKDGKFYKVLKNGYRKEIVGCTWRVEEIDLFVNGGYWVEVK